MPETTTPQSDLTAPQPDLITPQGNPTAPQAKKTASHPPRTVADRVYRAELALTGLESDPEILAALEAAGFTAARRNDGKQLFAQAQAILTRTEQARATVTTLTVQVKDAEKAARTAHADLAKTSRVIFKGDTGALAHLSLTGGRVPTTTAGFLRAADQLFASAEAAPQAIKDTLASYGYTAAKLTSEKAKITALHTLNQQQEQAKAIAQSLTPEQRTTLKALDTWVMQLRQLARIALRSKPERLKTLGI